MRLLVISQYFWPENFRINDLVAELARRGHQVTVLTGLPNYPDGKVFQSFRDDPVHFSRYQGAQVVRVPLVPRGAGVRRLLLNYLSFAVSASAVGLWKLRGQRFDALLTYQLSPVTVGIPAALLRATKAAPMALWVLDLWPETLHALGVVRSRALLRAIGKLVACIYRHSDLILAQSRGFIPLIEQRAGTKNRVVYFPSWAESVFDMKDAIPAAGVPVKPERFKVMFAGNIGDAQDFPAILAAAESLKSYPHIQWLIVGDGRMARWVADEIRHRKLQDAVLMLGRHPVEEMPSFFKHADALLVSLKDQPIFSMTIPGKLQSYLAAGIPILAMLNGEGAEVVKSSGSGLVCAAGDHAALAAAVLRLSEMTEDERHAMGRRGSDLNALEFGRSMLIDRLEGWLEELPLEADLNSISRLKP